MDQPAGEKNDNHYIGDNDRRENDGVLEVLSTETKPSGVYPKLPLVLLLHHTITTAALCPSRLTAEPLGLASNNAIGRLQR